MNEHDIVPPDLLADALARAAGKELPLKFDGFEVGTALILSEGHIVAKFNTIAVSEELQRRLFGETTRSVSITPRNNE